MRSKSRHKFKVGDLIRRRPEQTSNLAYVPYQEELSGFFLIMEDLTPEVFGAHSTECFRCMSMVSYDKKFVFYEDEILPLV
jgi:hypothetical protein